jgi:hypothetical protein
MYICYECGALFDTPDTYEEHHPYGKGYARETWAVCPCCETTNYGTAKECEKCGMYVESLEDGLCEECWEEKYGKQEE